MNKLDQEIKSLWDQRSKKYKNKIEGVLPKSFPQLANNYLNNWEFGLIKGVIKDKCNYKILDLGCGYGRLSEKILTDFKNVKVFGLDISVNYVGIYNDNLNPRGQASVGDMRSLPFDDESMDFVLVAASLMHIVDKSDQEKTLREIFRVLKDKGNLLIIERDISGYNLITLWGWISRMRNRKSKDIAAVGFEPREMNRMINNAGGTVVSKYAIPFFTLSLPIIFILNKFKDKKAAIFYLNLVKKVDQILKSVLYPSIYIAYVSSKR